jgi:O-antigen ligase
LKDAIIAAVAGAGMFGILLVADAYGERRWPTWAQSASNAVILMTTTVVVEAASDRPLFALVGIAVVVVIERVVRRARRPLPC